jgi:hypothetical protein
MDNNPRAQKRSWFINETGLALDGLNETEVSQRFELGFRLGWVPSPVSPPPLRRSRLSIYTRRTPPRLQPGAEHLPLFLLHLPLLRRIKFPPIPTSGSFPSTQRRANNQPNRERQRGSEAASGSDPLRLRAARKKTNRVAFFDRHPVSPSRVVVRRCTARRRP